MSAASRSVTRELAVGVERVFDVVVAEDVLPRVLHRWGPIPAVVGTRDLTGAWDEPGSERTVVLDDGTTAHEQVLIWKRPEQFVYRVDRFTGLFGRLVDQAVGSWEFTGTPQGARFRWTYSFRARGRIARVVLAILAQTAWARYMDQCADRCVALAGAG